MEGVGVLIYDRLGESKRRLFRKVYMRAGNASGIELQGRRDSSGSLGLVALSDAANPVFFWSPIMTPSEAAFETALEQRFSKLAPGTPTISRNELRRDLERLHDTNAAYTEMELARDSRPNSVARAAAYTDQTTTSPRTTPATGGGATAQQSNSGSASVGSGTSGTSGSCDSQIAQFNNRFATFGSRFATMGTGTQNEVLMWVFSSMIEIIEKNCPQDPKYQAELKALRTQYRQAQQACAAGRAGGESSCRPRALF